MEPRKPYFFYFVTNGRTRSGAPIYNILKHTPGSTTPRAFTAEIRCSDLWSEAYSIKDGCSFVQYIDGPEYHIRWVANDGSKSSELICAYTQAVWGVGESSRNVISDKASIHIALNCIIVANEEGLTGLGDIEMHVVTGRSRVYGGWPSDLYHSTTNIPLMKHIATNHQDPVGPASNQA